MWLSPDVRHWILWSLCAWAGLCSATLWASAGRSREDAPCGGARLYLMSASAFGTGCLLDAAGVLFGERRDTVDLAAISMVVKAISMHSDLLMLGSGGRLVFVDRDGVPTVPLRYAQWTVTTPLMLFAVARVSSASPVLLAVEDVGMLAAGMAASFAPSRAVRIASIVVSMALFVRVVGAMLRMMGTLATSAEVGRRVRTTRIMTCAFWSLFPIAWLVARLPGVGAQHAEVMMVISNVSVKLLLNTNIVSCIYVSQHSRTLAVLQEQEWASQRAMVGELRGAVTAKADAVHLLSSELRGPLNAITRLARGVRALRVPRSEPTSARMIDAIEACAARLVGVMNDVVLNDNIARNGVLFTSVGRVDLSVVLVKAVTATQLAAHVPVLLDVLPGDAGVRGDAQQLARAFMSLLTNAVKFTPHGRIRVEVVPLADAVAITIRDTGIGMTTEDLESFRGLGIAIGPPMASGGGMGLGIFAARQILAAHSGSLHLSSMGRHRGTTAHVRLPRTAVVAEDRGDLDVDVVRKVLADVSAAADAALTLPGIAIAYGSDLYS